MALPQPAPREPEEPAPDTQQRLQDGHSDLSAYERKRLKNITENAKFFAALKLHELRADDADRLTPDIERYQESLSSMVLSEENVRKVVKSRVCSMAIHPSESTILVAAGDKWGHVGLWNVSCGSEEGAHIFIPHSLQVSCMHFSPCNPAHLLSLSTDSLRCGDVTRAVFDEICRSEENFSSFDFLEDSASTALVGHWDGGVEVVDRRTPGTSSELSADIGFKRTRTVHVHPVNKQYFLAAGLVDVCIFDMRYLKPKGNQPVSSLTGHTKSVASAYFSPVTGSRVVTVCADDKLRHNSNTGRWLTRFRAIWDPKQEHCFVVGSMAQPRQINVFQDTGKLLHSFYNLDCLSSVCSINVVHPSRNILVGGNSSGRLHVFKE
ncbi:WD repeat-containing protein 76 [Pitangus sulphuratus]|nr:WD repeat-containing protein 76 [Pitangus sulphuratus]